MHAFVHVTMLLIIACYFPFTLSAPRPRPNPQDEAAIAPIKPIRLPLTRHSRPSNLTNRLVQVPGENGILARDAMPEQNREARAGAIDGPGGRGEAGFPTTNSSVLALMRTYVVPHVADQVSLDLKSCSSISVSSCEAWKAYHLSRSGNICIEEVVRCSADWASLEMIMYRFAVPRQRSHANLRVTFQGFRY